MNFKEIPHLSDILRNFLLFNPESPIIFNSGSFLIFFTLLLWGYSLIFNRVNARIIWLTAVSFFFYYKSSGLFVLLLFSTALVNYYLAWILDQIESRKTRVAFLTGSILLNLSFLLFYKYSNFLADNLNQLGMQIAERELVLPVGISFFTFQTISYLVDVYREEIKPTERLIDFCFYLSFFPQLVAGPIVRAIDFIPQIRSKLQISRDMVDEGLYMILKGFIKKAIFANYIAQYADLVYSSPGQFSGFENAIAMYAYTLQIYCDFSGYSDMAIGISLLLGFRLLENFRSPYQSISITEFWRRWHISLSFWLRDYVYIPLGGNRGAGRGTLILTLVFMIISVWITKQIWLIFIYMAIGIFLWARTKDKEELRLIYFTSLHLLLTMLVGGFWHGADWKFVFWGFMHGLGLMFHKWISRRMGSFLNHSIFNPLYWLLSFHFVAFLWIFFRAESFAMAKQSIETMFFSFDIAYAYPFYLARPTLVVLLLLGYALHFIPEDQKGAFKKSFSALPGMGKLIIYLICIQISLQLVESAVQPFIYFQF